jgi:hypothetical protein
MMADPNYLERMALQHENEKLRANNKALRAALDEWQKAYDEARDNSGPYIYGLEDAFEEVARLAYTTLNEQEE